MQDDSSSGLYIHVPFCARKCDYCAFYSETGDGDLKDRYTRAVIKEVQGRLNGFQPDTLFFGGGTPSLLSIHHWEQIIQTFHDLGLHRATEWTVECNPATVSLDKAQMLRQGGVNRISMGVQSLDEGLLDKLGRVHSRSMVFKSWDILRKAGFENINLDLMFAIPGQDADTWCRTLDEVIALQSEHLASYEVIYEEDTPLFHQMQAGEFRVDEDLACRMYEILMERTHQAGYVQYEIANFARDIRPNTVVEPHAIPSHACLHNIIYWRGGDYLGCGPSAVGRVSGGYRWNIPNTRLYCDRVLGDQDPCERQEALNPEKRAGEVAAFGLRMPAGWKFDDFKKVTGFDLEHSWRDEIRQLIESGHGEMDALGFRLTPLGLRFADAAAELFLR